MGNTAVITCWHVLDEGAWPTIGHNAGGMPCWICGKAHAVEDGRIVTDSEMDELMRHPKAPRGRGRNIAGPILEKAKETGYFTNEKRAYMTKAYLKGYLATMHKMAQATPASRALDVRRRRQNVVKWLAAGAGGAMGMGIGGAAGLQGIVAPRDAAANALRQQRLDAVEKAYQTGNMTAARSAGKAYSQPLPPEAPVTGREAAIALLKTLAGGAIGGLAGYGAGALRNSLTNYTSTDPLLRQVAVEPAGR